MAKPIKIHKDGESKWTEPDRLNRFLDEGWSLEPGVSPTVTKEPVEEVEEEEWDINEEDWADSIESTEDYGTMPDEEE